MKWLRKQFGSIKVSWMVVSVVLAIVLIAMGSKFDLMAAQALYHESSSFAIVFDTIGKFPAYAIFGFSGVLYFIAEFNCPTKWRKITAICVCILVPVAFGVVYGIDDLSNHFSSTILSIVIGVLMIILVDAALYFAFRKIDSDQAMKTALFFFIIGVLVTLTVFGLKYAGMRPRYKYVVSEENLDFRNWWDFDHELALEWGLDNDILRSWPSGHATLAASTVLFAALLGLDDKLSKYSWIAWVVSLAFAFLVGFSRTMDGSHYLSDIGWGLLIAYLIVYLFDICFYLNRNEVIIAKGNKAGNEEKGK